MPKPIFVSILSLVLSIPSAAPGASGFWNWFSIKPLPERLAVGLDRLDSGKSLMAFGETLSKRKNPDLTAFYALRNRSPAWISQGQPIPAAWQLLDAVRKCSLEALQPGDYHAGALDSILSGLASRKTFWRPSMDPGDAAQLELLLTDSYLLFARHMLYGRVRPKIPEDHWHVGLERVDLPALLDRTLRKRIDMRLSLQSLAPPQMEYGKMKYWLVEYRTQEANGGWPVIPDGPALGPETPGERVAALCRRLQASGEMASGSCSEAFTPGLGDALRKFQAGHGLNPTGKADLGTLRQLRVPVADRIGQIALNLEFWRWLPRDLGQRHLRVNIADYRLGAYENGNEVFGMRVVVGRKEDSTPVFSDSITFVQINPSWNVPASIAAQEMLPEIRKDPDYLAKHDMELLANWSKNAPVIRPDSIDWEEVDEKDFPFRVRQKNGDASALGRLKFQLTNPFNIYLHDTPARKYFERDKRALSHGCVRLADPMKLAAWVLRDDSAEWTRERLEKEIAKGEEEYIPAPSPAVRVHILYWTSFVDSEGGLQFRPDVYRWERRIAAAIDRGAATF